MKAKIEKLTPEQTVKLAEYAEMGVRMGLSCDPIDEDAARDYGERIMKWLGREYLQTIIVDSPLGGVYAAHSLTVIEGMMDGKIPANVSANVWDNVSANVWDNVSANVWDNVRANVWDNVSANVWDNVRANVWANVWANVGANVGDNVGDNVEANVGANVGANVSANVRANVGANVSANVWANVGANVSANVWDNVSANVWDNVWAVWPYLDGQWFSYYVAWYRYYKEVLNLELPSIWQIEDQIQFGCVFPLSKFCIISRRPESIHRTQSGRLHRDGGPAVRYLDGFSVYALNGVRVPEWLAEQPAAEIDPKRFAEIDNAQVRSEFLKKIGPDRLFREMGGEIVDSETGVPGGPYEIVLLDLGGRTGKRPYLKMINPSTGDAHLEGVHPRALTVEKALAWRTGNTLRPIQIT